MERKFFDAICVVCKTNFKTKCRRLTNISCSDKCKREFLATKPKKVLFERECQWCRKQFGATRKSSKFCNSDCSREYRLLVTKNKRQEINEKISRANTGRVRTPEQLEKNFFVKNRQTAEKNHNFGKKLTEEKKNELADARRKALEKLEIQKICEKCGKDFVAKHKKTMFCNWRCAYRYKADLNGVVPKEKLDKIRLENYESKKNKECKTCKTQFVLKINSKNKIFCSKECQYEALKVEKSIRVEKQCVICDKTFRYKFTENQNRKTCSKVCNMLHVIQTRRPADGEKISNRLKEYYRTHTHPSKGRRHSEEQKAKMRLIFARIDRSGKNNSFYGKKHSKEMKEKLSILAANRMSSLHSPFNKKFKTGFFFSAKNNNKMFYRSSWEEHAYRLLEENPNVLRYSAEVVKIPYVFEQKKKHYIPDILVEYNDSTLAVIEIKPKAFLREARNVAKFKAAKKFCNKVGMKFQVWTEFRLFPKKVSNFTAS